MKGQLLGHGYNGLFEMIEASYRCNWTYENTIMEHKGNEWWVYLRIKQDEPIKL